MINPGKRPIRRRRMSYNTWANKMALKWGISREEFESDPYDYRTYYKENYTGAQRHLKEDWHFPDTYKLPDHPTFSIDSRASGKKNRINPKGIVGGEWKDDERGFGRYQLSNSQINNGWDIMRTIDYVEDAEDNGVSVRMPNGLMPRLSNGDLYDAVLPTVTVRPRRYAGGKDDEDPDNYPLYANGRQYLVRGDYTYDLDGNMVLFLQGGGMLPEAVVTPSRRQRLDHPLIWKDVVSNLYVDTPEEKAVRNTTPTTEVLSAITGGMVDLNRLDASLNLRLGYDLLTGNFANASKGLVYGNNGLVSDKFAEEHPYLSAAINYSADALGGLLTAAALNPKKTAKLARNAGQSVADVVSGSQARNVVENIKNKLAWASAIPQRNRGVFPLRAEVGDTPTLPSISNDKIFIDDAGDLVIDGHVVDKDKVYDIADKIIHGYRVDPKTGAVLNGGYNSYVMPGVRLIVKDDIMHNTIERNIAAWRANGYMPELDLIDAYMLAALKELGEVPVGRFPEFLYRLSGNKQFGGFYNGKMISVNTGNGYYFNEEAHEARHLIDWIIHKMYAPNGKTGFGQWFFDRYTPAVLTRFIKAANNLDKILRSAYDGDFLNLSNLTDDEYKALGGEDYKVLRRVNMDHEAVTTNRDARDLLLSRLNSYINYLPQLFKRTFGIKPPEGIADIEKAPIHIQNELIDKTPDWLIFEALEDGDNMYGTAYIRFLRNNHELTSKKAALLRDAMKYVGVYGAPLTVGATLLNNE